MASNITILPALESDLPEMTALRGEAAEKDVLTRFLYGHRHVEAAAKEATALMTSLGKRFTAPTNRCHIVKAVDTTTNELVGWGLVRWEDGSWVHKPAPPHENPFIEANQKRARENWLKIIADKGPHVCKFPSPS